VENNMNDDDKLEELLQRIQNLNEVARDDLWEKLWEWAHRRFQRERDRLILRLGASDAAQEFCLRVHCKFGQFKGQKAPQFRAWCGKILRNWLRDAWRHHGPTLRRQEPGDAALDVLPADVPSPSQHLRGDEQQSRLGEALAALPARLRAVFEQRYLHGHSFAEVGRRLEISEANARLLFFRATRELRHILGEHDGN
jgi:RNA polymerase sigma factor (sigma-70 family)